MDVFYIEYLIYIYIFIYIYIYCFEGFRNFKQHIHKIRPWFQKRAYRNIVLDEELAKVRFRNQEKTCSKKDKGIPLVVTYHPILQALEIYFHLVPWFHFEVLGN